MYVLFKPHINIYCSIIKMGCLIQAPMLCLCYTYCRLLFHQIKVFFLCCFHLDTSPIMVD